MQLTPSIFKAYDIRGVVPTAIDTSVAEGLGRAFGTVALREGQTAVAVGRDGRLSGPDLSAALMRGLAAVGVEVLDIGLATTPMLYLRPTPCAPVAFRSPAATIPRTTTVSRWCLPGAPFMVTRFRHYAA